MAYQSLYRRYRPQTFAAIRGQEHVVSALRNAVVKEEVGHAYLLHGPRGTGKTTSARVLAKALNCENLGEDGEPCGACESCISIEKGRSFDLHELDAASNNKVEDMRDLLGKVNLGTPGRAKVYILDEVHMLTSQAENALLKTLEEPPDHVIWVLATTEPHKVVETIRSRCQVFELSLLGAEAMAEHVRWVIDDAMLDVPAEAVDHVVASGGGSVRDTLSALDRVVAAGGVVEIDSSTDVLLDALADSDVATALSAVGDATGRGRDPRTIGEGVVAGLRDAFLTTMGAPPPRLTPSQAERAESVAGRMTAGALTRALETLGVALVEMRQAPDPRVDLEVALVRLCRPAADRSLDAVTERLDRLEAQLTGGAMPAAPAPAAAPAAAPASSPAAPVSVPPPAAVPPTEVAEAPSPSPSPAENTPPPREDKGPAAAARRALGDKRAGSAAAPSPASAPAAPAPAPPTLPVTGRTETSTPGATDLRAIRPQSPTEVVHLASIHLGLARDHVVDRAAATLGPASAGRSPDDLARLWLMLVDEQQPAVDADPSPAPAAADLDPPVDSPAERDDGDPGPTPPDLTPPPEPQHENDGVDLDDLVDAPTHADHLIEQLTEAFPGAELHTNEEPEQP